MGTASMTNDILAGNSYMVHSSSPTRFERKTRENRLARRESQIGGIYHACVFVVAFGPFRFRFRRRRRRCLLFIQQYEYELDKRETENMPLAFE